MKFQVTDINPLNAKLNPTCHLLALLGAHHIFHISVLRVNNLGKVHHLWLQNPTQFLTMELSPYSGGREGEIT